MAAPIASLIAFALALAVAPARAGDTESCVAAYKAGQTLRKAGKLRASRERLLICSQQQCTSWMSADCTKWVTELDEAIPSLVIEARDASGKDLTDVRVLAGDTEIAARLDGAALPLDPGSHTLRFERGDVHLEETVVLREGERRRRLSVTFPAPAPLATTPPPPVTTAPPPILPAAPLAPRPEPLPARRPVPTATWVVGGLGAASLVASGILGIVSKVQYGNVTGGCSPRCDPALLTPIKNRMIAADVALGTGIVALAAAAVVWIARPSVPAPPTNTGGL